MKSVLLTDGTGLVGGSVLERVVIRLTRLMEEIRSNLNQTRLSYDFFGHSAKNEPLHATSIWRAVAVAGSSQAWS